MIRLLDERGGAVALAADKIVRISASKGGCSVELTTGKITVQQSLDEVLKLLAPAKAGFVYLTPKEGSAVMVNLAAIQKVTELKTGSYVDVVEGDTIRTYEVYEAAYEIVSPMAELGENVDTVKKWAELTREAVDWEFKTV